MSTAEIASVKRVVVPVSHAKYLEATQQQIEMTSVDAASKASLVAPTTLTLTSSSSASSNSSSASNAAKIAGVAGVTAATAARATIFGVPVTLLVLLVIAALLVGGYVAWSLKPSHVRRVVLENRVVPKFADKEPEDADTAAASPSSPSAAPSAASTSPSSPSAAPAAASSSSSAVSTANSPTAASPTAAAASANSAAPVAAPAAAASVPSPADLARAYVTSIASANVQEIESEDEAVAILSEKKPRLLLIYMFSCGWCKRLMPDFNAASALAAAKGIAFARVEVTLHNSPRLASYAKGFPSFVGIYADGRAHPIQNLNRSVEGMLKFCETLKNPAPPSPPILEPPPIPPAVRAQIKAYVESIASQAVKELETEAQVLELLASKQPTVFLLYMHSCGWCKKLMPDFNKAAVGASLQGVAFARFEIISHSPRNSAITKFTSKGFPSFVAVFADGRVEAVPNMDRSESGMLTFAATLAPTPMPTAAAAAPIVSSPTTTVAAPVAAPTVAAPVAASVAAPVAAPVETPLAVVAAPIETPVAVKAAPVLQADTLNTEIVAEVAIEPGFATPSTQIKHANLVAVEASVLPEENEDDAEKVEESKSVVDTAVDTLAKTVADTAAETVADAAAETVIDKDQDLESASEHPSVQSEKTAPVKKEKAVAKKTGAKKSSTSAKSTGSASSGNAPRASNSRRAAAAARIAE